MTKKEIVKKLTYCRVCKERNLSRVFTLGPTPLANAFLSKKQAEKEEAFFPLDVYFCNNCSFLQLGHVVSPEVLFNDYVYVSSTSKVFVTHFEDFAKKIFLKFKLDKSSLVIDIGSNDGILLKPFKKLGTRILGIEPAKEIAKVAEKQGIETISKFFSTDLARKVVNEKGKAKIITANNVFAHIDDLDEVIKGLKILLSKDGAFVMEAPYLVDFLDKNYFDLVYHEHLSYWSVSTLITLFRRFDMEVFDVAKVDVHGGTIRVFVGNKGNFQIEGSVKKFIDIEKKAALGSIKTYLDFEKKIQENKVGLISLLASLKSKGKKIAAYGAPAKGNTLLNFFSIGIESLDYVVDDSSWKQGLYTPGKRIPVVSSEFLYKEKPDYLLILAWNFADSIMSMHRRLEKNGVRFIIPVPVPKVL